MVYVCWNRKPEVVSHRMPYRFSTLKLSCRLQVSTSTAGYSSTQPGGANEAMSRSTRPAAHAPPSPPRPAATCPNVSDVSPLARSDGCWAVPCLTVYAPIIRVCSVLASSSITLQLVVTTLLYHLRKRFNQEDLLSSSGLSTPEIIIITKSSGLTVRYCNININLVARNNHRTL